MSLSNFNSIQSVVPASEAATNDDPKPELLILPDVPIQSIVSLIPLQPLIVTLPLLHPRFDTFRESTLKSNHRLDLYIGNQNGIGKMKCDSKLRLPFAGHLIDTATKKLLYPETDFYCLRLATLDCRAVHQLLTLMPSISHLEVYLNQVDILLIPMIIQLLNGWSSTLQTFKFTGGSFQSEAEFLPESPSAMAFLFHRLLGAINTKLSSLEHLTLDINGRLYVNTQVRFDRLFRPKLDMPILGQLTTFQFNVETHDKEVGFIWDALREQASEKLTSLAITFGEHRAQEQFVNSPFVSQFEILPFDSSYFWDASFLALFERRFEVYAHLKLYELVWPGKEPLSTQTRVLSTLGHLLYLKLDINLSSYVYDEVDSDGEFKEVQDDDDSPTVQTTLPLSELTPLPSVKVLEIKLENWYYNHDVLQASYWAHLFPSVQIIKLTHLGDFCRICIPFSENMDEKEMITDYTEVMPCLRKLFTPLMNLPSLRKIFYQRNDHSECIAEFTPTFEFVREHAYIC